MELLRERDENEIISLSGNEVLRDIASRIQAAPILSITADGTTDRAGNEYFSICLRCLSVDNFYIQEEFIGLYNPPDSKSETLSTSLQDVCLRLNPKLEESRGHTFDGAAGRQSSGSIATNTSSIS